MAIAGIIALMMLYSGLFSYRTNRFPIHSSYQHQTVSTGMSRAFSAIIRADFEVASQYNRFALRIFLFFSIQFLMRGVVSVIMFNKRFPLNQVVLTDVLISVFLFLWAFIPLILAQIVALEYQ